MVAYVLVAFGLLIPVVIVGTGSLQLVSGAVAKAGLVASFGPEGADARRSPPLRGGPLRSADRAVAAGFLGLLVLAWLLLVAAWFVPLSPAAAAMVVALSVAAALASRSTRHQLGRWLRSGYAWSVVVPAVLVTGTVTLRQVTLYDTGLYHYQAIRWLSEHGNVTGLALLHRRFGFISSWFALHAPLDAGAITARSLTMLSGLTVALVMVMMAVAVRRLLASRAHLADLVILAGAGVWVPIVVVLGLASSASPDLPASLLPLLIAWTLLVPTADSAEVTGAIDAFETTGNSETADTATADTATAPADPRRTWPGVGLPWLVAVLGMGLKLSVLPTLLVTAVWQLVIDRSSRRLPAMAITAAVVGLPLVAVYLRLTGCPAFPSGVLCLDISTAVPVEVARATAVEVTEWARWSAATPPDAATLGWIPHWISNQRVTVVLLGLWALSILAAVVAVTTGGLVRGRPGAGLVGPDTDLVGPDTDLDDPDDAPDPDYLDDDREEGLGPDRSDHLAAARTSVLLAAGLSIVGVTFTLVTGPSLRFMLGPLVLGLALGPAVVAARLGERTRRTGVLVGMLGLVAVLAVTHPGEIAWRLPPALASTAPTEVVTDHGWSYRVPVGDDRCWDAPLPCTPATELTDRPIRPRGPGLGDGFERVDP